MQIRPEEVANTSEQIFNQLLNYVADSIYISDMAGNIIAVNEQACRELCYSQEELTSKHISELDAVHVDREQVADHFKKYSLGSTLTFETSHRRKDVSVFSVEVNVRIIDFNGQQAVMGVARNISERKQAEEEIRLAESQHKSILKTAMDGFWLLDGQGHIIEANDAYSKMSGYSIQELTSMKIRDFEVIESASETAARIQKVIELGEARFETIHRRKDGSIFPVEISVQYKPENGGYQVAFLRDLSARKQMEEAYARSERFLNTVIDTEPECIKMLDENGNLLMMNRAGLEMIQADSFEQVKGNCMCHLVTGPYKADFMALTKRVFQGMSETLEFETVGLKGRHIWLETHAVPFRNDIGEITALLGITRDITERKRIENELQKSNSFNKSIIESSTDCIKVLDLQGRLQYMSLGGQQILGITNMDEFLNISFEDFWKGSDHEAAQEAITKAQQGQRGRFEGYCPVLDGTPKWWEVIITPIKGPDGNPKKLLAVSRDITDRKNSEEEREDMQKQLLHAQKLESMGVLAGGIAHDFNNILTAIIGNADLALMKINKESPGVENLHRIEQAAARAAELAKQMLAYSGKGKFVIENISLNILLKDMLHMLEVSISKKAVLRLNLHENLPAVEADATQIRQIIMNLAINSSEAIGEKNGLISVTTGCIDCDISYLKDVWLDENLAGGLYVYLEIADTGCGMDKETLSKIFDPFFTTKFTGRGLGMAAVLGIVRGHKGAIKVYSEPDKGSSFKILLPASKRPLEIFNGESHHDTWKGSGTVLLVDDEETVRDVGKEMLQELGFTTITANDGREAIEVFKANPDIAFVILDLTMPRMDGEQCFRELHKIKPDVKVIISSGFNEQEVTQKFVGKGLAGFIQKPYKLFTLKEVVTHLQ